LAFQVQSWPNSSPATPLTLTGNGNVGIGTTGPGYPLQVNSAGSAGWTNPAGFFQPGMTNGNSTSIFVGLSNQNYQSAQLSYTYNSITPSLSYASLALQGYGFSGVNVTGAGNVGIGTTAPGAKLEVDGSVKLTSGSGASLTFADGTVQSTAYTGVTCGGDYAESVDVTGNRTQYEPGDVLVLDTENAGRVLKSAEAYSTAVSGIYSTKPGVVGRRQTSDPKTTKTEVPMAMVGVVPTKVSAENGAIKVGDLLVSSTTSGYAMKGTDRGRMLGAVIGKAMGNLNAGMGVIEVLVTLQ
jgi:hypothetical protein